MSITIKEVQEWEKKFALKKGLPPQNSGEIEESIKAGFFKLVEEVGELSEKLLRKKYEECQEELSDIIIFVSKIGKLLEDYHEQPELGEVLKAKMAHSETRELNKNGNKLTKPKEFEI